MCGEEFFAESIIPADSTKFWQGVVKQNNFKYLTTYALTSLITPASNAIVERVYSFHAIKAKPRNKTQIKSMNAFVRIPSHLLSNAVCCKDFECTAHMVRQCNSVDLYGKNESSSVNVDETEY